MAISPMQLPSPKAYDPNQAEITNLVGFRDPYTADRASINADNFRADRLASGEQYQHALDRQQQYYSKALDLQAEESSNELLPKLLAQPHGIGFASGIRGLQGVLERMQQANPGLYGQYVNQAFQGEKAKALQAGGAGAKSALEAGLQTPPEEFYGATGVQTGAVTPLSLQVAAVNAASHGDGAGGLGGSSTWQLPPRELPGGGGMATVSYSPNKKANEVQQYEDMERKGLIGPGWRTRLQPNGQLAPQQQSNQQGAPTTQGKPGLPPQQARQGPPPTQGTTSAAPNRTAQWDAIKDKVPTEYAAAVERARKQNGGNVVFDERRRMLIGAGPNGKPVEIPVPR